MTAAGAKFFHRHRRHCYRRHRRYRYRYYYRCRYVIVIVIVLIITLIIIIVTAAGAQFLSSDSTIKSFSNPPASCGRVSRCVSLWATAASRPHTETRALALSEHSKAPAVGPRMLRLNALRLDAYMAWKNLCGSRTGCKVFRPSLVGTSSQSTSGQRLSHRCPK